MTCALYVAVFLYLYLLIPTLNSNLVVLPTLWEFEWSNGVGPEEPSANECSISWVWICPPCLHVHHLSISFCVGIALSVEDHKFYLSSIAPQFNLNHPFTATNLSLSLSTSGQPSKVLIPPQPNPGYTTARPAEATRTHFGTRKQLQSRGLYRKWT